MWGKRVLTRMVSEWLNRWWWRWHPTVALRYLPIVEEMRRMGLTVGGEGGGLVAVEVGSGGLGIGPYLKQKVVGVDRDFAGPGIPWLVKIRGVGERLPIRDKSADWVILVDVLEHIRKKDRFRVVNEAVRVSRRWVVIAQPCGRLAEGQDRELDRLYRERFGRAHPFLEDHVGYGLPGEREVEQMVEETAEKRGRKVEIKKVANLNLGVRRWLMRGWMTRNRWVDIFFRKVLLLAIPVLRRCNWGPVYRWIWFVELD